MTSNRRLVNEFKMIEKDQLMGINKSMFILNMVGDDIYHWHAILYGPEDSLYEKYEFDIDIIIPSEYPNIAPIIKFMTPIEHININKFGDVCLDILKENWNSQINISTILISIASLLSDPNPDDAFNPELAALYKTSKSKYEKLIKVSCKQHARPKNLK